jgi:CBS domain-containing protein
VTFNKSRIQGIEEIAALRLLRRQYHADYRTRIVANEESAELYAEINAMHDAFCTQVLLLTERMMAQAGHGAPPVSYAFVLLGSGGRSEQTLSSDQDNGIIYADRADEGDAHAYFHTFGEQLVTNLVALGYPRCDGAVMASNPQWCAPLATWRAHLRQRLACGDWENVRYLLIAADARAVYGDESLLTALQEEYGTQLAAHPASKQQLYHNTTRHKQLIGPLGQLLTEAHGTSAGSLDIKYGAYIPLVNSVRYLSLIYGVRETETLARLTSLVRDGHMQGDIASEVEEAFRWCLTMRLRTSEQCVDGTLIGGGMLAKGELSQARVQQVKQVIKVIRRLEKVLRKIAQVRLHE